jgi:hypothetical protein
MHILILPIPFLLLFRVRCVDCVIDNPMANLDACLKALTCSPHLNLNTRVSRLSTKFHGLLLLAVKLVPPSQAFRDQRGRCTKLEPLRWAGTVPHRNRTQKLPRHRPSASSKKATFPAFTAATRHGARCFVMAMSLRSLPRAPLALRSCRVGAIRAGMRRGHFTSSSRRVSTSACRRRRRSSIASSRCNSGRRAGSSGQRLQVHTFTESGNRMEY